MVGKTFPDNLPNLKQSKDSSIFRDIYVNQFRAEFSHINCQHLNHFHQPPWHHGRASTTEAWWGSESLKTKKVLDSRRPPVMVVVGDELVVFTMVNWELLWFIDVYCVNYGEL